MKAQVLVQKFKSYFFSHAVSVLDFIHKFSAQTGLLYTARKSYVNNSRKLFLVCILPGTTYTFVNNFKSNF